MGELAIQHGFITLFVAAFPLAPLFALINNIFEIRLDARKLLATMRRPLGQRAQDIGVWAGILRSITMLSVLTNGWTIAQSSEFIPHMVFKYFESNDTSSMKGYVRHSLSGKIRKKNQFLKIKMMVKCLNKFTKY